jgi:glycosyltransferase involved in cell wall biosynthesis
MKIVFLAPFGIRPKGTLIARMIPLAAELQNLGHTVTIIAPPYTNPEDSGKTEVVRGVTVKNISLGPVTGAAAAPFLAHRMFWLARAERPDLVHLFKPKGYGGLAAMVHLVLCRLGVELTPLFVDTDDWEGKGGMNDLHPYSRAERLVFGIQEVWLPPQAAGVTVASRTLQTKVWGMGIPPERVLYLPNCVEDVPPGDGGRVRRKLGIPVDAPVLLLYTRFFEFSQEKLHFLFAEIHRRSLAVRFLVVGQGRRGEEELLLAAGRERGFADALVMGGWLDPTEIADYLAAADVAIYPFSDTLINRSKCPAKLTEILRAGIPVVADSVGQLAEYIKPGVSGILCDPDNWQEMADRVVDLLVDPARRKQLGAAGREYMLTRFSWRNFAAQLDAFYGTCHGMTRKDNP